MNIWLVKLAARYTSDGAGRNLNRRPVKQNLKIPALSSVVVID